LVSFWKEREELVKEQLKSRLLKGTITHHTCQSLYENYASDLLSQIILDFKAGSGGENNSFRYLMTKSLVIE